MDFDDMEREENFSIAAIGLDLKDAGPLVKQTLETLWDVELQALALGWTFKRENYVPASRLSKELASHKIGKVHLPMLAAFFLGYLTAEHFSSIFDHVIFGSFSMDMGEKKNVVGSALKSVLYHINEIGKTELPDRRKSGTVDVVKAIEKFFKAEQAASEMAEKERSGMTRGTRRKRPR